MDLIDCDQMHRALPEECGINSQTIAPDIETAKDTDSNQMFNVVLTLNINLVSQTMALQTREFAFRTSNALKQSVATKSHIIKQTTNFPISLITALDPSLKDKFETRKAMTKHQSKMYKNDMTLNTSKTNALIIESEDQSTMDKVTDLSRYIHHHSSVTVIHIHPQHHTFMSSTDIPCIKVLFISSRDQNTEMKSRESQKNTIVSYGVMRTGTTLVWRIRCIQ